MAGNIVPRTDGGSNLGTADKEFNVIYAKSFGGTIASQVVTTNSPTFTGTPAAPTAAAGTNTTQIATTAFANAAASAAASSAVSTHNLASDAHSATIAAAVNTHNAATDAHSTEFAKYLPLSGGAMSGDIAFAETITIPTQDTWFSKQIPFNTNGKRIAYIQPLHRANNETEFNLTVANINAQNDKQLKLCSDGTLTWAGKEVERVVAQGDGYIRYASGLQMCWGLSNNLSEIQTGKTVVTYPVAFSAVPSVIAVPIIDLTIFYYKIIPFTCSTTGVGFSCYNVNDNFTADSFGFFWQAIGRWK